MEGRTHEILRELGFTTNEARAYLALLHSSPATGYEVANGSEVPRSAIYPVLRALEGRGLVDVLPGQPVRYVPIAPQRLVGLLRARQARALAELGPGLEALAAPVCEEVPTWTIRGYDPVLDEACALIDAARTTVYASIWRREAERLAETLGRARARGVAVVLFSFTALPQPLDTTLCYGIDEAELERYRPHGIILLVDGVRALFGGVETNSSNRAVVTGDEALLGMARSNLLGDLILFGQRLGCDVSNIVGGLATHLAPVEELLARAAKR